MRVISGKKKGKKLLGPKTLNIRPTEDRIKESMFNIISPIKEDAFVLDLFAGTGSIGIEFISRGAKKTVFVDNSIDSVQIINKNLALTNFTENSLVLKMDVLKALNYVSDKNFIFDYIFMDPPYEKVELYDITLDKISALNLVKKSGILIAEHDSKLSLRTEYNNLSIYDIRKYGNKSMTYFKNNEVHNDEGYISGKF
ncbi:MAG: 16S rRNA (guanine(966)-N(2))-methyltransferase RsmD [Tissierellales bacterium]|nr:16S rRNA (guanine(966)-N(2))-methyltransferase RsmD [Tissierellales bacterium]